MEDGVMEPLRFVCGRRHDRRLARHAHWIRASAPAVMADYLGKQAHDK
jgi:hypothetical protein